MQSVHPRARAELQDLLDLAKKELRWRVAAILAFTRLPAENSGRNQKEKERGPFPKYERELQGCLLELKDKL